MGHGAAYEHAPFPWIHRRLYARRTPHSKPAIVRKGSILAPDSGPLLYPQYCVALCENHVPPGILYPGRHCICREQCAGLPLAEGSACNSNKISDGPEPMSLGVTPPHPTKSTARQAPNQKRHATPSHAVEGIYGPTENRWKQIEVSPHTRYTLVFVATHFR